jgi:hypothetical protein
MGSSQSFLAQVLQNQEIGVMSGLIDLQINSKAPGHARKGGQGYRRSPLWWCQHTADVDVRGSSTGKKKSNKGISGHQDGVEPSSSRMARRKKQLHQCPSTLGEENGNSGPQKAFEWHWPKLWQVGPYEPESPGPNTTIIA